MAFTKEEFFKYRIDMVKDQVSLYEVMTRAGFAPRFEDRSAQIHCCFLDYHSKGRDNKPSARYYPKGERGDYESYYCWVCTPRPMDVIGFVQRLESLSFVQALRKLEQQYGISYEQIDLVKDVQQDLDTIRSTVKKIDPKVQFNFCELLLRTNKTHLGLERFKKLSYILDRIYHLHDDSNSDLTLKRLSDWVKKIQDLSHQLESRATKIV